MRGLDPRIHQENKSRFNMMDCRVKPTAVRFAQNGCNAAQRIAIGASTH